MCERMQPTRELLSDGANKLQAGPHLCRAVTFVSGRHVALLLVAAGVIVFGEGRLPA